MFGREDCSLTDHLLAGGAAANLGDDGSFICSPPWRPAVPGRAGQSNLRGIKADTQQRIIPGAKELGRSTCNRLLVLSYPHIVEGQLQPV